MVVWKNILIDGHNRHEICTRNDIGFETIELYFQTRDDVKIWIIENQFGRRNLQPYTKTNLALLLEPLIAKKAKANQGTRTDIRQISDKCIETIDTKKEIAKVADVSHLTLVNQCKQYTLIARYPGAYKAGTTMGPATPQISAKLHQLVDI